MLLPTGDVLLVLWFLALLLQGYAFVHCLLQRSAAFPAAGKWNKWGWTIVTVLALLVMFFMGRGDPIGIFQLVGFIASCVYMVDVRPAVREISGGRGGGGGRESGRW